MNKLEINKAAPDFSLDSSKGGQFKLKDARGKWVILYLYPRDNTPGCTKEACNFRDFSGDFEKAGALIFGVSTDSLGSHQKFIDKFNLPFPLLADTEKEVAQLYGVWKEKSFMGKKFLGIERTTFIINPEGKLVKIFPKVKVDLHHQEVLDFLKSQN